MIFVIGGSDQGKREFVKETFGLTDAEIWSCTEENVDLSRRAIEHIERYALGCVRRGEEPKDFWMSHLHVLADKILISDDISCGIVPVDDTLRAWREAVGRANNAVAREAEQVYRVFCGLGQRLK